jgi:hypothetical protein
MPLPNGLSQLLNDIIEEGGRRRTPAEYAANNALALGLGSIKDAVEAKRQARLQPLEPDRVEYCLWNGKILNSFPYPYGHPINHSYCLAVIQRCLSTYWRNDNGALRPASKVKPLPDLVRIVDVSGAEICRWSVDDLN